MPETMGISAEAKSGDGTVQNVGIKMSGSFQCPECRQKFESEKATTPIATRRALKEETRVRKAALEPANFLPVSICQVRCTLVW